MRKKRKQQILNEGSFNGDLWIIARQDITF